MSFRFDYSILQIFFSILVHCYLTHSAQFMKLPPKKTGVLNKGNIVNVQSGGSPGLGLMLPSLAIENLNISHFWIMITSHDYELIALKFQNEAVHVQFLPRKFVFTVILRAYEGSIKNTALGRTRLWICQFVKFMAKIFVNLIICKLDIFEHIDSALLLYLLWIIL